MEMPVLPSLCRLSPRHEQAPWKARQQAAETVEDESIAESGTQSKRVMAKSYQKSRGKAYKWLAEQMGVPQDECHIGYFTIEQCQRVVEICEPYSMRMRA